MKASCRVIKTCQWLELIFLLTIQAAAEIQSRLLLVLMIFSLLPATCIFLEHSTGMSVASACVTCLVVALGSCFYGAKRLDAMQQSVFRLAIATEAHYFQVLEARANTGQRLVQVSTMLANHSGASSKVLQTEKDLKTNYFQAKRHRSLFQTSVCDPLARIGLEVVAKIKPLTELDEKEGAVDVLHCEVMGRVEELGCGDCIHPGFFCGYLFHKVLENCGVSAGLLGNSLFAREITELFGGPERNF